MQRVSSAVRNDSVACEGYPLPDAQLADYKAVIKPLSNGVALGLPPVVAFHLSPNNRRVMTDYKALIAELQNARLAEGSYSVNRKLRELIVYLTALQQTGNYLIAEQATERYRD